MAGSAVDPAAVGGADLARQHRLALDLRFDLQRHQLDGARGRSARPNEWPIWLGQPTLARASIIIVNVWRILPLATVIILAGLSSIPQDIHDAAEVDGAGFWRHHFQITMPLILPITLVALLFGIIFTFTDMIVVFVLTRGGPYDTTQVIASWAYFTGIQGGDLAGGAAISLFLFPVLAGVAILFLWLARHAEVT